MIPEVPSCLGFWESILNSPGGGFIQEITSPLQPNFYLPNPARVKTFPLLQKSHNIQTWGQDKVGYLSEGRKLMDICPGCVLFSPWRGM